MKNNAKLKLFLNIKNKAENIDTMFYGKAIRLQKHRGNRPHVSKMVQKTSFKTIDTDIIYNHFTDMSKFVIPKVTLTCPSEEWPIWAKKVKEKAELKRATFWDPPPTLPLSFQRLVYKLTALLQEDFTAPLLWSPLSKTPKTSFHSAFRPSEESSIKHRYHQFRTTTSNNYPILWMSWRISLWCSTFTLPSGRKRILILTQHWSMA